MSGTDRVEGFAIAPNWFVRDPGIASRTKVTYLVLASHTGRDGTWWISHRQIAEEAGVSESSVIRSLRDLRDMGLVTWDERRTAKGDRVENLYRIAVTPPSGHSDTTLVSQGHHPGVTVTEQQEEPEEEPKELQRPPSRGVTTPPPEPEGFREFWGVWPIKQGLIAARVAYARALTMTDPTTLRRQAVAYARTVTDPQYAVRASRWLAEQRWTDVYPEVLISREEWMQSQPPMQPRAVGDA